MHTMRVVVDKEIYLRVPYVMVIFSNRV
jgi:hypothetical protein